MILHIGGESVVYLKDVVAVFDAACAGAPSNRDFIARATASGDFVKQPSCAAQPSCACYIVAMINGRQKVFTSPISSVTLLRRAESAKGI